MLTKKIFVVIGILFVIFAFGLVGFFAFSVEYGDGLEKTMEIAEREEGEPIYKAPLDYGENYTTALLMGALGFAVTFISILVLGVVLKKRKMG